MEAFGPNCKLGEGPLWHPLRSRLFWFDIPKGRLISTNPFGGQQRGWSFGEPASAAGWIDEDRLLVATASGLQDFNLTTGVWEPVAALEDDEPLTRSNDGRCGPDGSFWIGTMGSKSESELGSIYRFNNGQLNKLASHITVPNSICFSPKGDLAYFTDTPGQVIWKWELDSDGNPVGEKVPHIDLRDDGHFPDGSVCDAEGYLWNAQWDGWRLVRYAPDSSQDRVIEMPVSRPTCPAFGGTDLRTLYVTSASVGLSDEDLEAQPQAGQTFRIEVDVEGIPETKTNL